MPITLHHPNTKETVTVRSRTTANVYKKAGWTEQVPKKTRTTKKEKKDA